MSRDGEDERLELLAGTLLQRQMDSWGSFLSTASIRHTPCILSQSVRNLHHIPSSLSQEWVSLEMAAVDMSCPPCVRTWGVYQLWQLGSFWIALQWQVTPDESMRVAVHMCTFSILQVSDSALPWSFRRCQVRPELIIVKELDGVWNADQSTFVWSTAPWNEIIYFRHSTAGHQHMSSFGCWCPYQAS